MKLLSDGNTKLHNVAIFDLPAKISCPNHDLCWRTCYAHRQQQYWHLETIRKKRMGATKEWGFVPAVVNELKGKKFCRIHSSGDFFAQWYISKWERIVEQCPDTQFWAYTKTMHIFDFRGMMFYPNVNIISSILPGGELNYGLPIVINILKDKYPEAHICETPHPYVKGYCMGICTTCLTENMVLFEEHGHKIKGGESWSNVMWGAAHGQG